MNELFDLTGKTAIVTGGMGQLGAAFSSALVKSGAKVAVFDIADEQKGEDLFFNKALTDGAIKYFKTNITKKEDIKNSLAATIEQLGVPEILINNAALDSPPDAPMEEVGYFEDYPESSFDQIMDVNVKGTFLCCQVIGGCMAEKGNGSVINISSIYGMLSPCQDIYDFRRKKGETYFKPSAYSVSKSAVFNLTRYLATYWAKKNVRVNTLTLAGVFNDQQEEFLEEYCKRIPVGRMADPNDYIGAIIFLSSNASSYMTGANLIIDGGWSAW